MEDETATSTASTNILAFLFFLMAALWMLFAILYAASVMMYLRMRSTGRLRDYPASHPMFGRVYLCQRPSNNSSSEATAFLAYPYIPMGPIFRMFLRQNARSQQLRDRISTAKVMTSEERLGAMTHILQEAQQRTKEESTEMDVELAVDVEKMINKLSSSSSSSSDPSNGDDVASTTSTTTQVCAICLSGYDDDEDDEDCESQSTTCHSQKNKKFSSFTCAHSFHQDCILEWLSRPACVECPCCRVPMVEEEIVWKTVRHQRKQKSTRNNNSNQNKTSNEKETEKARNLQRNETGSSDESEDAVDTQASL